MKMRMETRRSFMCRVALVREVWVAEDLFCGESAVRVKNEDFLEEINLKRT